MKVNKLFKGLLIVISLFCFNKQSHAQFTKLFDFNKLNGEEPGGSLITDGTYFYGMTEKGGTNQEGIVFKIKPDGSGFTKLMDFKDNNGSYPLGSLFFDGTFLYGIPQEGGTSLYGGASYYGNIFRIKTDGTSYRQLYDFIGGNDGAYPQSTIVSDGTFLYGTALSSIFKIMPDGTLFTVLYNFPGLENSLLLDGNFLYGTSWDGNNGNGSIFKIRTDGTQFTTLYDFNGLVGKHPHCSLISDSSYLYGTTAQGGTNNYGVVFKIKPDGTDYQTIHYFSGIDGIEPLGSLIFNNGFLYGMTEQGGANDWGTIYKIKPDGTQFKTVYDLQVTDGCCPIGSLIPFGGFLYGMTNRGGAYGNGTIFKLDTIAPKTIDNSIAIYPNPSSSSITIDFHQRSIYQLEIRIQNVLGQTVFINNEVNPSEFKTIFLNQLPDAIYFLEITTDGIITTKKIIKQ